LRLRVTEDQLQLRSTLALDAAGGVDRVHRHLRTQPARLPGLGQRPRDRVDRADLERLRLRAHRPREAGDRGAGQDGLEQGAATESHRHRALLKSSTRIILRALRAPGPDAATRRHELIARRGRGPRTAATHRGRRATCGRSGPTKARPEPATRSLTVAETMTSPASASAVLEAGELVRGNRIGQPGA